MHKNSYSLRVISILICAWMSFQYAGAEIGYSESSRRNMPSWKEFCRQFPKVPKRDPLSNNIEDFTIRQNYNSISPDIVQKFIPKEFIQNQGMTYLYGGKFKLDKDILVVVFSRPATQNKISGAVIIDYSLQGQTLGYRIVCRDRAIDLKSMYVDFYRYDADVLPKGKMARLIFLSTVNIRELSGSVKVYNLGEHYYICHGEIHPKGRQPFTEKFTECESPVYGCPSAEAKNLVAAGEAMNENTDKIENQIRFFQLLPDNWDDYQKMFQFVPSNGSNAYMSIRAYHLMWPLSFIHTLQLPRDSMAQKFINIASQGTFSPDMADGLTWCILSLMNFDNNNFSFGFECFKYLSAMSVNAQMQFWHYLFDGMEDRSVRQTALFVKRYNYVYIESYPKEIDLMNKVFKKCCKEQHLSPETPRNPIMSPL